MPKCIKIKRKHRQVCIGDIDEEIEIQTRAISTKIGADNEDYVFTTVLTLWALVETLKDVFIIDEVVGGDIPISHKLIIRKPDEAITSSNWVLLNNERYRIVVQTDYDERGEYLELMCTRRGDEDREAAHA